MTAALHCGPAADVIRENLRSNSVDMVYLDPPFGNGQVWTGAAGSFDDRWQNRHEADGWLALERHNPTGAALLKAVAAGRGKHAPGYLGAMAAILIETRRVLKGTGTCWLHHDDTFGAELRLLGDLVFGPADALGTIIWHRTAGAKQTTRALPRNHDTVAVWAKTRVARYRLWRIRSEFAIGDPIGGGHFCVAGFADDRLNAQSKERVGYPTQKPVALLDRFIRAATVPGDTVLDPTCGSGTTLVAAMAAGRRAIGVDISTDALAAARARLPTGRASPLVVVPKAAAPMRQLSLFGEAA